MDITTSPLHLPYGQQISGDSLPVRIASRFNCSCQVLRSLLAARGPTSEQGTGEAETRAAVETRLTTTGNRTVNFMAGTECWWLS